MNYHTAGPSGYDASTSQELFAPTICQYPFTCKIIVYSWVETACPKTVIFQKPGNAQHILLAPAPSIVVEPASLYFLYFKILRNVVKLFPDSPGFCHLGNPASRPLFSHLPY